MKELYLALCERLSGRLPEVRTIDLFNNQPERQNETTLILPAVLIEMQQVNWSVRGEEGAAILRFYLLQEIVEDTYQGSGEQGAGSAYYFDLLRQLSTVLQGFSGETFSALQRTTTEYDSRYTYMLTHIVTFKCNVTEKLNDNEDYIERVLNEEEIPLSQTITKNII
jgi:hypothetical protein